MFVVLKAEYIQRTQKNGKLYVKTWLMWRQELSVEEKLHTKIVKNWQFVCKKLSAELREAGVEQEITYIFGKFCVICMYGIKFWGVAGQIWCFYCPAGWVATNIVGA